MKARVQPESNLFDYFNEQLEGARGRARVEISGDTHLYLATLLAERARADRPRLPEATLAELHGRAANAPPAEQARAYRELGDNALYVLGYFEERLERTLVGPAYYADMGRAAYHRVDMIFKRWFADAFGPVFRELSVQFNACVELVGAVRDAHVADHPEALIALYGRWRANGSEAAAARLRAMGMLLPDDPSEA